MKDSTIYLEHVLESIELIERYVQGLDREGFPESVEKQGTVPRRIGLIGEAVKGREASSG